MITKQKGDGMERGEKTGERFLVSGIYQQLSKILDEQIGKWIIGSCHALQFLTFGNIIALGTDSQVAARGAEGDRFHLGYCNIYLRVIMGPASLLYASRDIVTRYFVNIYKTACW